MCGARSARVTPGSVFIGHPEQLCGLDVQRICELPHELEARIKSGLFQLTEIAPADFGLIREVVLRKPFRIPQAAQIAGENLPQVHAGSEPTCSKYTPRYTEQNESLRNCRIYEPVRALRQAIRAEHRICGPLATSRNSAPTSGAVPGGPNVYVTPRVQVCSVVANAERIRRDCPFRRARVRCVWG